MGGMSHAAGNASKRWLRTGGRAVAEGWQGRDGGIAGTVEEYPE